MKPANDYKLDEVKSQSPGPLMVHFVILHYPGYDTSGLGISQIDPRGNRVSVGVVYRHPCGKVVFEMERNVSFPRERLEAIMALMDDFDKNLIRAEKEDEAASTRKNG